MGGLQWTEIYFSQFWMLRSQDQGHGQFSVWWEPVSWFIDNHFLLPFSHGRRGENTLFHGYGLITSRSHLQLTSLWLSVSTYDWGCKSDVYISSLILPLWICIHLFVLIFLLCWTDQSICLACSSWALSKQKPVLALHQSQFIIVSQLRTARNLWCIQIIQTPALRDLTKL